MATTKNKANWEQVRLSKADRRRGRRGFTLIELLVSVSIISLLIALFITNFDRATAGNKVANDVEIFRSKLQQARLLAGSTQIADGPAKVGYYGIYLSTTAVTGPTAAYQLVRVPPPDDLTGPLPRITNGSPCPSGRESGITTWICKVESVPVGKNVNYTNATERIIAYRTPTQQLFELRRVGARWVEQAPVFGEVFRLNMPGTTATVSLEAYTGNVNVTF